MEGAPGCLALSALRLRRFAILGHGMCAQIWINKWPYCGPHCGHGRCSPAVIKPDILEPGEALNFAHDSVHLGTNLPFHVNMFHEKEQNPSKGVGMLLLESDQPDIHKLDYGEALWELPRCRKRFEVAVVAANLDLPAGKLVFC